jgi:hypothetical protein
MTKSMLDTNLDTVQEIRELPAGKYVGRVISYKSEDQDERTKISLAFKVLEAVGDADLTGVNLNRYVYKTIIITEKSNQYVKKDLIEAGLDVAGLTYKEIFSSLEGQDVEFSVAADPWHKKTFDKYRPTVTEFRIVA